MVTINEAYKNKALREPECRFCGKYEYSFQEMPEHVHIGLPIYHLKDKRGAHFGIIARECLECGHIEFFFEKAFRNLLELPKFEHRKPKVKTK